MARGSLLDIEIQSQLDWEADNNTKFFHAITNGRRIGHILYLKGKGITDPNEIKFCITSFLKDLYTDNRR